MKTLRLLEYFKTQNICNHNTKLTTEETVYCLDCGKIRVGCNWLTTAQLKTLDKMKNEFTLGHMPEGQNCIQTAVRDEQKPHLN